MDSASVQNDLRHFEAAVKRDDMRVAAIYLLLIGVELVRQVPHEAIEEMIQELGLQVTQELRRSEGS